MSTCWILRSLPKKSGSKTQTNRKSKFPPWKGGGQRNRLPTLLAKANVELNLLWLPRLQNIEADALTNSVYRGFNPDLRQEFCLEEYEGLVLKQMLAAGEELNSEIKAARQKKQKCVIKDRTTTPLRVHDPWDGP